MRNHSTQLERGEGARERSDLQTALVDSVTHELRTPLTSIKASVTALLTDPQLPRSQRNELLTVINEEADRLNRLVGEAVEAAQLGEGVILDLKPHAVAAIIDAASKDCRALFGGRSLSVQLSPGLPAVCADLNRAKQALLQLLENATKYSPPGSPITVTAELNAKFVVISVSDQGNGIEDSEQGLIFERFYRGKHHCKLVQGTGMGLPIASAIIKAHGGSLSVTCKRGHGSTFSFTLPIDEEPSSNRSAGAAAT